jgi:hypothetical protein
MFKMKCISFLFILLLSTSCGFLKITKQMNGENLTQNFFKTIIPFEFKDKKSIILPVYFAKENITRHLKFDNHAPTLLQLLQVNSNNNFKYVGKSFIKKSTPEGGKIDDVAYLTDSVQVGGINFNHVLLTAAPNVNFDGLFGINTMCLGIWKIDFEKQQLTFASSIDSIANLQETNTIPANFDKWHKITLPVTFQNNKIEKIDVDLGYNRGVIVSQALFNEIDADNKAIVEPSEITSAAGTSKITLHRLDKMIIKIGENTYTTSLRTNEKITKRTKLIGLEFFTQFKFVVIDFINKVIYLSKEKR